MPTTVPPPDNFDDHPVPPSLPLRPRRVPRLAEPFEFIGRSIEPGTSQMVDFNIGEFYTLSPASIPVTVFHGKYAGPRLFVSAALHGNELNGIEIARRMVYDFDWSELHGTLLLVPVMNLLAFMRHSRTLPDGRDLNRQFPGSATGSSARRIAHRIYNDIIKRCDYGIDLHTAGAGRTNYPQIRADMKVPQIAHLARSFGASIIIDGNPIPESLRSTACRDGIYSLTFEGGEPLKFQRGVIDEGLIGVRNVLISLHMVRGIPCRARKPYVFRRTKWLRCDRGGLVELVKDPGDFVQDGETMAYMHTPFGREVDAIVAPYDCLVIGSTTIPTVHPGDPLFHVAKLERRRSELIKHPLPKRL